MSNLIFVYYVTLVLNVASTCYRALNVTWLRDFRWEGFIYLRMVSRGLAVCDRKGQGRQDRSVRIGPKSSEKLAIRKFEVLTAVFLKIFVVTKRETCWGYSDVAGVCQPWHTAGGLWYSDIAGMCQPWHTAGGLWYSDIAGVCQAGHTARRLW